jgi:D-glycero-D-manno-heptose 1,7-bisphosphate phosphatase
MAKALFLDRDGVINREVFYLSRPEQVEWVPGLWQLCEAARDAGYLLIVVTNQSGIARGMYTETDFHALMAWMQQQFRDHGVEMAAYYYCPHHPRDGIGEYKRECADRKPNPGMLLRAARDFDLDLEQCVMVGDRCSDVAAANAARVGNMFLLAGTEAGDCEGKHLFVSGLLAAAEEICGLG